MRGTASIDDFYRVSARMLRATLHQHLNVTASPKDRGFFSALGTPEGRLILEKAVIRRLSRFCELGEKFPLPAYPASQIEQRLRRIGDTPLVLCAYLSQVYENQGSSA